MLTRSRRASVSLKRTVVYGLTGRPRFFGFALERVTRRSIRDPWRFKAAHMRRSQKHLLILARGEPPAYLPATVTLPEDMPLVGSCFF